MQLLTKKFRNNLNLIKSKKRITFSDKLQVYFRILVLSTSKQGFAKYPHEISVELSIFYRIHVKMILENDT